MEEEKEQLIKRVDRLKRKVSQRLRLVPCLQQDFHILSNPNPAQYVWPSYFRCPYSPRYWRMPLSIHTCTCEFEYRKDRYLNAGSFQRNKNIGGVESRDMLRFFAYVSKGPFRQISMGLFYSEWALKISGAVQHRKHRNDYNQTQRTIKNNIFD